MRRRAFTLIEILAVIIILGIAAAITVNELNGQGSLQAASAARTVIADLLYAQSLAITDQEEVYVSFDTTNQQYGIYTSMSPLTAVNPGNLARNYPVSVATLGGSSMASVTLASANFGNNSTAIAFDEMGTPYYYTAAGNTTTAMSATGTVVLSSGIYSTTISVAAGTGDVTSQ